MEGTKTDNYFWCNEKNKELERARNKGKCEKL